MCGAGEIYCRQSDCIQPVGWYIIEPCDAFAIANSATTQAFDGVVGSLNWNAAICGCSIPRVLRRQRCSYRTCNECAWIAMNSTFTAMQQWAEGAKEHPASWAQRHDDYLLFRRTKMKLKRDHEHTQRKNGKQRAASLQKNFVATNSRQHGTTNVFSNAVEAADSSQWPSQNMFFDGHLDINSSDPYRISEAAYGDEWNGGVEDNLVTTQELPLPAVPNLNQEAPNIVSEFGLYLDYPPDALPQDVYEPTQPISTFQEYSDQGEDTNPLSQLQTKVLPQSSNAQFSEVDFNDPFWAAVFASSGDSVLNSHTNTYQADDTWERSI